MHLHTGLGRTLHRQGSGKCTLVQLPGPMIGSDSVTSLPHPVACIFHVGVFLNHLVQFFAPTFPPKVNCTQLESRDQVSSASHEALDCVVQVNLCEHRARSLLLWVYRGQAQGSRRKTSFRHREKGVELGFELRGLHHPKS